MIHAVIDAACVAAVYRAIPAHQLAADTAFMLVLAYDVLAFASQFGIGLVLDRLGGRRTAARAGIALTALAVLAVRLHPLATLLFAGAGNALFHVGAGADVLRTSPRLAAPAGVFVGPGALGLGFGLWMGRTGHGPLWPFIVALAAALVLTPRIAHSDDGARLEAAPVGPALPAARGIVLMLLPSVSVRAFIGCGAAHACAAGTLLTLGIPIAGCVGKATGGVISDRLGWSATSVGALLLSAPLIAFGGSNAYAILAGLLLLQMTMPVTLAAVAVVLPRRLATAFGLPCLALIVGALPTFFPAGKELYGDRLFFGLIVASAGVLFAALRLLGRHTR